MRIDLVGFQSGSTKYSNRNKCITVSIQNNNNYPQIKELQNAYVPAFKSKFSTKPVQNSLTAGTMLLFTLLALKPKDRCGDYMQRVEELLNMEDVDIFTKNEQGHVIEQVIDGERSEFLPMMQKTIFDVDEKTLNLYRSKSEEFRQAMEKHSIFLDSKDIPKDKYPPQKLRVL